MKLIPPMTSGIEAPMDTVHTFYKTFQRPSHQPISLVHKWTISNCRIYFSTQNAIEYIDSASFSPYSSNEAFFLRLYPNGYDTDQFEYVSIFVHRKSAVNNYEITPLTVECEITIINRNGGKNCHSKKFSEQFDSNTNFHGFDIFIKSVDLFDTTNNLLEDNTLTICCKLNIHGNTESYLAEPFVISNFTSSWNVKNIHEVEYNSESITYLNEYNCKHQWTIGEFTLLKNPNPFKPFTIDFPWVSSSEYKKVQFKLKLYPDLKMKLKNIDSNVMKICLTTKSDEVDDVKVDFKFFLVDSDRKHREVKTAKLIITPDSKHEWTDFYDRELLFDEKKQLLSGIDLILCFEAKISLKHVTDSVEIPTICILESLNPNLRHYATSDLVLVFDDGLKLYSHKEVLIARSSVFAEEIETKLFQNDKEEVCLKISDISFEVFEQFLQFIYTGNTSGFDKFAFELLKASQNYKLEDLKIKCEEWLSENALENLTLKCLTLTEAHNNIDKLKNNLIEYFHKKPSNLSNEIFKHLRESNPKLLAEIYPHLDHLLKTDENCDVELKLTDDSLVLHAHKAILASKSLVFAAMFAHDTLERNSNVIHISDMDVDICEHLLRFIYTEEILPKLDDKTKFDIYVAADKYELRELKYLTQKWIYATMTVDSVIDMLVLADMFNVAELKAKAMRFIHENADQVTKTEGFKLLCQNRYDLMAEVYLNIVNMSKQKMRSFEEEDISVL